VQPVLGEADGLSGGAERGSATFGKRAERREEEGVRVCGYGAVENEFGGRDRPALSGYSLGVDGRRRDRALGGPRRIGEVVDAVQTGLERAASDDDGERDRPGVLPAPQHPGEAEAGGGNEEGAKPRRRHARRHQSQQLPGVMVRVRDGGGREWTTARMSEGDGRRRHDREDYASTCRHRPHRRPLMAGLIIRSDPRVRNHG
jgi:hypothetical protein